MGLSPGQSATESQSTATLPTSLDPLTLPQLILDSSLTSDKRVKRLPVMAGEEEWHQQRRGNNNKKRNSHRMKVTNRKLYNGDGFPFDPQNDLLDGDLEDDEDGDEDDEDEDYGDELDTIDDFDEDNNENNDALGFGMGRFHKSLLNLNSKNVKDLNNNPSSPTTDSRFPPHHNQHHLPLDDHSREQVPLPGPPRDLIAQIVRPRFVTLSWMEPHKNPDEVVSYDVFYKMTSSER